MPITKDLKPTEFELTVLCPVGICLAQHTYAFDKDLKKMPTQLKEAKARMNELTENAHRAGKHNIGGSA